MEIKFFNVGHGDSIILEWQDANIQKIGIVDCKKHCNSIPTIDYLKSINNLKDIDIIILTHPHIDHYSGISDLLDYIENSNLKIKCFAHTLFGDPKYLNWTEAISEDRKKLDEILSKVEDFVVRKGIIEKIEWPIQNWTYVLNDIYSIKAFAPSDSEIRTRKHKIQFYQKENKFLCSSSSNYLSTILLITNNITQKRFLLTSDAVDISFERLQKSKSVVEKLKGIQIPHHGSSKSHNSKFWESTLLEEDKEAYISAGLNEKYNLPDYEVVAFFDKIGFKIDITNNVNGYKDFFDQFSFGSFIISNALDDESEIIVDKFHAKECISSFI